MAASGRVDFDRWPAGVATGEPPCNASARRRFHGRRRRDRFSLSAPASDLTVLNVAGRPVATVMQDRATERAAAVVGTGSRLPGRAFRRNVHIL